MVGRQADGRDPCGERCVDEVRRIVAEKAPVMGKVTRDEIVKNWRAKRSQEEAANAGDEDLQEFTRNGMPIELTDPDAEKAPAMGKSRRFRAKRDQKRQP
jgi:hypothetical protein